MAIDAEVYGRNMEITDRIQEYVDKKVSKLDRYISDIDEARVDVAYVKSARNASDRQVAQTSFDGTPSQAQTSLRITEIHFAPLGGRDDEFIELRNIGTTSLDLSGVSFTRGITYVFPNGSQLGAGEWLILAADTAAFQARYLEVLAFG